MHRLQRHVRNVVPLRMNVLTVPFSLSSDFLCYESIAAVLKSAPKSLFHDGHTSIVATKQNWCFFSVFWWCIRNVLLWKRCSSSLSRRHDKEQPAHPRSLFSVITCPVDAVVYSRLLTNSLRSPTVHTALRCTLNNNHKYLLINLNHREAQSASSLDSMIDCIFVPEMT